MPTLLVVDDEPSVCYSFRRVFGGAGVEVLTAATVADGWEQFRTQQPDVVVLDLKLPDGTGLDVFEKIRAVNPKHPVIFITAHGSTGTAIEAMKRGAFDYIVKPVDFERLRDLLQRAFEAARLMQVPATLPGLEPIDQIIGHSPLIQEMCKTIGRVAPQDVNVLICGESGVGKELVARAIYHHSQRAQRPFLAINCAALPENLIESELFGHEQGAFTGAERRRIGKFEQCHEGTIFLDEIGDMPLAAQAKILRLLQEQRFERVGGGETIAIRVRVLAATNQDLEQRIAAGRFRKDLFYRLNVVTIHIPPLRERREDIAELAHSFLYTYNRDLGLNIQGFDPEALACLRDYDWPGNVRQLQGVVKQAMLRTAGAFILPESLPPETRVAPPPSDEQQGDADRPDLLAIVDELLKSDSNTVYAQVMRVVERMLLVRVLQETHGHQSQASERLGLSRSTLRYKLRDLGVNIDRVVEDGVPKKLAT